MDRVNIVVVDDDEFRVTDMAESIRDALSGRIEHRVEPRADDDLREDISGLLDRKKDFEREAQRYDHRFDKADILVIDYDLSHLHDQAYMTGEDVAQLARLYTEAGPIVSVNRYGPARFDLRLRTGSGTWSDYGVAHKDLGLEGLWCGKWEHEYRPWYWPALTEVASLFEKRVDSAKRNKHDSVADLLGIPKVSVQVMPDELYDKLVDPESLSALSLARDHIVPPKVAQQLPDKQLVRVAAAAIGDWLSDAVLPRQDVLVDAPHLVSMYPSLLDDRSEESLNACCALNPSADLPIDTEAVDKDRFRKKYWLDRPAWWAEDVLENDAILENVDPWAKDDLSVVFAEDASRFCSKELCKEFEFEGLLKKRWVRQSKAMREHVTAYKPESRLAD